jgi:hypothetical protein
MDNRKKQMEKFVARYKAAIHANLTRQEFAAILGVKPDSVRRRRLSIYHNTGLELPHLKDGDEIVAEDIDKNKIKRYKNYINKFYSHKEKFQQVSDSNESSVKRYVVTSAQNATPVHDSFLSSLLIYCEHNNAELIVIPYRYRNPTSIWTQNNEADDYWDIKLNDFINDQHVKVNDHVRIMGHIKIQPTAVSPLSGFDSLTGEDSAIFAHPAIELKCVPTPSQKLPKILTTSGSVTVPNYTDTKTGHKGEFNHSLAAAVLEVNGDAFHIRHVHGDDETGEFYDLDCKYTPNGVEMGHRAAALVTGDIHAEFHDPTVEKATYIGDDSIMEVCKPEVWVLHDLEDFYSRNHHHRGKDLIAFGKHHFGRNNVEESLQLSADFVDKHSRNGMLNLVVKSNHDEALDRWLREADPKIDPENAVFYHYMKYHQYKNVQRTETGFTSIDPFEFWCNNPESQQGLKNVDKTVFLKRDESFVVSDVELGFHGDIGPNGTRGTIRSFSKIGPKLVIGHSHTPGIFQGVYQVGVSARLNLEYASGPSSWLHTHCLIYPDGHRTLIHVVKGKWRVAE